MKYTIIPLRSRSRARTRSRRSIRIAAALAVVAILCGSLCVYAETEFRKISDSVVRLHVVANSDSDEDQALKLKVRDEVTAITDKLLGECSTRNEAILCVSDALNDIANAAQSRVIAEGFDYEVRVSVNEEYFPTRHYDSGSLPAGIYTAVRVEIGSGEGHNWWCVLFPPLCMINAVGANPTVKPTAVPTPSTPPTQSAMPLPSVTPSATPMQSVMPSPSATPTTTPTITVKPNAAISSPSSVTKSEPTSVIKDISSPSSVTKSEPTSAIKDISSPSSVAKSEPTSAIKDISSPSSVTKSEPTSAINNISSRSPSLIVEETSFRFRIVDIIQEMKHSVISVWNSFIKLF